MRARMNAPPVYVCVCVCLKISFTGGDEVLNESSYGLLCVSVSE